jgi:hypothetical protein
MNTDPEAPLPGEGTRNPMDHGEGGQVIFYDIRVHDDKPFSGKGSEDGVR